MNLVHVGSELRRFAHGKLPPIALLTIMLLPLLFGGLFVWSYWDPIGRINRLPVAYVNSDVGAEGINAGAEITKKLLQSDKVTFTEVTPQQARDGVADGTYYFAVEIPTDFSAAVLSVKGDDPHQATLNTTFNNDNGLIATTLGNQVVNVVLSTINSELGAKVTDNLLVGFNTIGDGLNRAADGATKISDGNGKALEGAQKLEKGADKLHTKLGDAEAGAQKLADGAQRLDQGIDRASSAADQLADGLAQLDAATSKLGAGLDNVSGGVQQVNQLADQARAAQDNAIVPLVNVSTQLKQTNIPEAIRLAQQVDGIIYQLRTQAFGPDAPINANLTQLQASANDLAQQITGPAGKYVDGMHRAADGSKRLAEGLHKLGDGSDKLVVGTRSLADGTSKLSAGAQQLTVGANQLVDGLVQLDEGSGTLALKLNEARTKVPNFPDDKRDLYAHTMSTPVKQHQMADKLSLFGEGLAPIFISLGLFVGSTVTWMLLHPVQRRAVDSGTSPVRVVLASYLPALVVGLSQATVMFFVQRILLSLHASHEAGMWMAMCLTAATFQMITLGINSLVGATVGRVLCISFMALQIVSSGGLYPPETQPTFLRWFHTFDPMTYTVDVIRQMIFHVGSAGSGADGRLLGGLGVMFIVWLVFFFLAVLGALNARHMAMKDLHPEVAV